MIVVEFLARHPAALEALFWIAVACLAAGVAQVVDRWWRCRHMEDVLARLMARVGRRR